MDSSVLELAMVITISPLLALGAACFDPVWCRAIVNATGLNFGKIWISGAIVAVLMFIVGIEFGIHQSQSVQHWTCD